MRPWLRHPPAAATEKRFLLARGFLETPEAPGCNDPVSDAAGIDLCARQDHRPRTGEPLAHAEDDVPVRHRRSEAREESRAPRRPSHGIPDHRRLIAAVLPERYPLQGRHEQDRENTPGAAGDLDRTKTSYGTLMGIN
jgi:hypothetical protein